MKKIWGFGSACVDIRICTADYGPGYTAKLLAREKKMQGGGACANFLAQVSRLGGEAGYLGKLGKDAIGDRILAQLAEEKVDISHVIRDEKALSPFNVAVYAGENWRRVGGFLLPNALGEMTEEELSLLAAPVEKGDIVYCEIGEIPLPQCEYFLRLVKEKGAVTLVDVDLDPVKQCGGTKEEIDSIFALCDYLLPNTEAVQEMTGAKTPLDVLETLSRSCHARVIVTAGEEGAWLLERGKPVNISVTPVKPLDTVGAGDAFHGGFAFALARGMEVEKAVLLGCICGAHNCMTFGARDGMLRAEELAGKDEW